MSDIVSPLLQWLNANPQWAGFATFIISAAESVAIIGTIVPGSITMTAIGTLAGAGIIPLWATLIWAMLGAVVGDGISYWMGHYFKDHLRRMWPFKNNPGMLEKGEIFVHKYGSMSVFIGRFVGPVRALVPLVAGMLGMKPLQFTVANVASAILWAPAYMLPGILLGAVSLELPPDIALHVILALTLMTLFIMLCLWLTYKIIQLASIQIEHNLVRVWDALKKSRFSSATVLLKHHNPKQHHGQLILAFYFLLTTLLFVGLVIYTKAVGSANIFINNAFFHLFRGLRSETSDHVMLAITLLGQKQVVLPVILALFIWLIASKHMRAAFHALALGVLAAGCVFVIKQLIQSERPWGIFFSPESYSMPSGHATLAATVYIGIAFIIALPLSPKRRWLIYTPAVIVAFLVGISRIYLGAHWFTDVLAAWLLSIALLMIVILSFNRQKEKPINLAGVSLVCATTLALSYTFYFKTHFVQLNINYTQINWPSSDISLREWWENGKTIPEMRASLFGIPSQRINIQWNGDFKQIKTTLLKNGWESPPPRDWISTLHRIADVKSSEFLPMVSPQYLDKKPALTLIKRVNGKNKLVVIRLWDANRTIQETNQPLWVGTVGLIPRSYSWLYRRNRHFDIEPTIIFQNNAVQPSWQTKVITDAFSVRSGKIIDQKIILIREKN